MPAAKSTEIFRRLVDGLPLLGNRPSRRERRNNVRSGLGIEIQFFNHDRMASVMNGLRVIGNDNRIGVNGPEGERAEAQMVQLGISPLQDLLTHADGILTQWRSSGLPRKLIGSSEGEDFIIGVMIGNENILKLTQVVEIRLSPRDRPQALVTVRYIKPAIDSYSPNNAPRIEVYEGPREEDRLIAYLKRYPEINSKQDRLSGSIYGKNFSLVPNEEAEKPQELQV